MPRIITYEKYVAIGKSMQVWQSLEVPGTMRVMYADKYGPESFQKKIFYPAKARKVPESVPVFRNKGHKRDAHGRVVVPRFTNICKNSARLKLERIARDVVARSVAEDVVSQSGGHAHSSPQKQQPKVMEDNKTADGSTNPPTDHAARREARDEQQRKARAQKEKKKYKAIPKNQRKAMVLKLRDKRNPLVQSQSGVITIAAALAASIAGFAVGKCAGKISRIADDITTQIKEKYKELKAKLGKVLAAVPLVVVIWYVFKKYNLFSGELSKIFFAVISAVIGPKLWDHISGFFREEGGSDADGVKSQSGVDFQTPANLISALLCFSAFKGKSTPANISEFTKRISNFDRMGQGIDSLVRWIFESIEAFVSWISGKFGKTYKRKIRVANDSLKDWYKRVDKAVDDHNTNDVQVSNEAINHLVELAREGTSLLEVYRGSPAEKYIRAGRANVHALLHPHLGAINARKNSRVEPVMIVFLGKPGVGKTVLIEAVCTALLTESGIVPRGAPESVLRSHIFQKGTSEYWNGYSGQYVVVFDDVFQMRPDCSDKDNEYINIIRMVGNWAFPLNFADLDSKGKIYFSSKLVVGTTNLSSIQSEASKVIQDTEAVTRRIKFPYEMRPVKQFALEDGKLNYPAFYAELKRVKDDADPLKRFPWHVWEVSRHDFDNGQSGGLWEPMQDLLERMIAEIRSREKNHAEYESLKSSFMQGLLNKSEDNSEPEQNDVHPQSGSGFEAFCLHAAAAYGAYTGVKTLKQHRKLNGWEDGHEEAREAAKKHLLAQWYDSRVFLDNTRTAMHIVLASLGGVAMMWVMIGIAKTIKSFICAMFNVPKKAMQAVLGGPKPSVQEQSNRPNVVRPQSDARACANIVYENGYRVCAQQRDGTTLSLGQVTFVTTDLAIQPQHYVCHVKESLKEGLLDEGDVITFTSCANINFSWTITVQRFLELERISTPDKDLDLVRYLDVRSHKNIVSKFISENDVESLSGEAAVLEIGRASNGTWGPPVRSPMTITGVRYGKNMRYDNRRLDRYYRYVSATQRGDCGAPLVRLDESRANGGVCMGIHVAGSLRYKEGYATIVTREMLAETIGRLRVINDRFFEDLSDRGVEVVSQSAVIPFSHTGSFLPLAVVAKPVSIAPRSKIYRVAETFGELGDYDARPAHLSPVFSNGEVIYPMDNAVRPYSSPVYIYEQKWLPNAVYIAMRGAFINTLDCSRRIYSYKEAVCGVSNEKFRSIPRNTAAGFPYVYDVKKGKKDFFGDAQDYDLSTPMSIELEKRVEYIISCAERGERLAHVFVDFLKDEIRPKAKVDAVATRLISSAPLDYTIAWRRYFGAFSSAIMRNHTVTGMAPGICTYTDWERLVSHLSQRGNKVFDGDFKAFDSSEQPCIHRHILTMINKWYDDGEVNARVREVLWQDLVHSRHIGGKGADQRHLYQWNKSLPSGHPFTTIVNSIYSLVLLVGAYISVTGKTDFWEHVSPITYGDDNVCNVTDERSEQFNQLTVAAALEREFHVVYTPGRKDGVWTPTCEITDVTFLKRSFLPDAVGWLCPLEKDSFYYTCYYNKNRKDERRILQDVLETTLYELSLHTQETWDVLCPPVLRLMARLGFMPQLLPTRETYLTEIRKRGDQWY